MRWAGSSVPVVQQLGRAVLNNGALTVCVPVRPAFPAALWWFATEGLRLEFGPCACRHMLVRASAASGTFRTW